MQREVLLPQVELTMESALIAKWLVRVGDHVRAEQPLLEVETQKATSEVPSPTAGYVRKLCVEEGQNVNEKALLCILTDTADEQVNDASSNANGAKPAAATASIATTTGASASADGGDGLVKASPAARRLARELKVDLASLKGSGPDGRVTEDDVKQATSGGATAADGDWTTLPATRVALIQQMQKSLAEIPQIQVRRQLDVVPLIAKGEGITFTHRLAKAVAAALAKHPALRTMIDGNRTKVTPVSVAIAMDTPHGLVAPVVRDADKLSLQKLATAVAQFRAQAESNSLRRADLVDGPFAITNLGMLGVDQFDAFVFHGQTAVLSVGKATSQNNRSIAWFGLAVDHRIVDGAEAARFLATLETEIRQS